MRLSVLLISASLLCVSVEAPRALTMTAGDCSPIVNIKMDLGDREAFFRFLKEAYPGNDVRDINFVVKVATCGQFVDQPKKRMELLLFALDEMLLAKQQFYIPALDRFIDQPTQENFRRMMALSHVNISKIEQALSQLISVEVALQIQPSARNEGEKQLRSLSEQLLAKLSAQVDKRTGLASPPAVRGAMIAYRNEYVKLVHQIAATVEDLKQAYAAELAVSR
ncbi:hypothetical protein GOC07_02035 [Sinorhizobium meliloti]|nr:hypothetical protein [Sinorhizobium meliloti]